MSIRVRRPEDANPLVVVGEALRPLVTHADGAAVEILDTRGSEGCGPPPHKHPWDEVYVVLSGSLRVIRPGAEPIDVHAGTTVFVPGGTVHAYQIVSAEAHFLTIVSRGEAVDFFAGAADQVQMNPLDVPALIQKGAAHGIEFVL